MEALILKRIFAVFLLLIFFLVSCSADVVETTQTDVGSGRATLAAVGDIFLTDDMLKDARQADGSYDFSPQFSALTLPLSEADLTIGNFEGNFIGSDYGNANGSYPDELADTLYDIGFDLLQTANSYTIFNGLNGLERTKAVIEEAGMSALGSYVGTKDKSANQVVIREVNGIRFAFIAFTKGLGGLAMPTDTDCSVDLLYRDYTSDYSEIDTDYLTQVVEAARAKKPDIIVAALHWGSENIGEISTTQEEIASLLLKKGVDVILGSHSHLLGQIEQRTVTTDNGETKNCLIAYSLGDFCAVSEGECNTSVYLRIEFLRGENGRTDIVDFDYVPISAIDRGEDFSNRYCVLCSETAIELYESNYYDRISEAAYGIIVSDVEAIKKMHESEAE